MKKIFKKLKLRDLIFFIVGAVIFGSTGVLATTYVLKSSEIQYKDNKSVQEAIDELFVKAENRDTGSSETLPLGNVSVKSLTVKVPYTGSYDNITCVYGTNENYGKTGTISGNTCTFMGTSGNQKLYYKLLATKIENNTAKAYENSGTITTTSETNVIVTDIPKGTKAIIYLDPTNLSATCNEQNSSVGGNAKSGCMKWYAFKEDSSSYTMILDHNTTAKVAWNSIGSNASMSEVKTALTTDTAGWSGNPRLITGQEIADITGNTSWTSTGNWFYLDSNNQTQTATSVGASKYYWLFDYTYNCTSYGCKVADSSIYGYWTSTPKDSGYAWLVRSSGHLGSLSVGNSFLGARPVITISKSSL